MAFFSSRFMFLRILARRFFTELFLTSKRLMNFVVSFGSLRFLIFFRLIANFVVLFFRFFAWYFFGKVTSMVNFSLVLWFLISFLKFGIIRFWFIVSTKLDVLSFSNFSSFIESVKSMVTRFFVLIASFFFF